MNQNISNTKIGDILRKKFLLNKKINGYNVTNIANEYFISYVKPFILKNNFILKKSIKYQIDKESYIKICNKYNIIDTANIYIRFFYALCNRIEDENLFVLNYNAKPKNGLLNSIIEISLQENKVNEVIHKLHIATTPCIGETIFEQLPESSILFTSTDKKK